MALSPMMQHYVAVKEEYPDCILFYRLGDFYEMFFEDAKEASEVLELTLTGRDCGLPERAPMCGVPFHAADTYIGRLVERGYKVAICEQVEDPREARGIVRREVVRVVTPGTVLSATDLEEDRNNYICGIASTDGRFGLATADISTGQCFVSEFPDAESLLEELLRISPAEIVCDPAFLVSGLDIENLRTRCGATISQRAESDFDGESADTLLLAHFGTEDLSSLHLTDFPCGRAAAGGLFRYLYDTQKSGMKQMTGITARIRNDVMVLDPSSRRNLELTETIRDKKKTGSLLWVLDQTKTAMGARMLRAFVEQPLLCKEKIERRLGAVQAMSEQVLIREEIRETLRGIYDLERLASRITSGTANPRDLIALRNSLEMLPAIRDLLGNLSGELLADLQGELDPLEDLYSLIAASISEEPPVGVREGGIIRDGYHGEVDRFRLAQTEGKTWLAQMEAEEREKTGIKNLRIRFNKVFGYYLEVTNSYKELVPDSWTRRQTLANAERYTTDHLKELEETILGAQERLSGLEYELFCTVRDTIGGEVARIQQTARVLAAVDVYASLSFVAERNRYVRPTLNEEGRIRIREGRHPVVERMLRGSTFVPNDTDLDKVDQRVAVITGPNMAGKSTYMRQVALITLMAQIGSFVPASEADIGIADRIFTRVGASDDLAGGQSTFMVEMSEVANILRHATADSLLILDEIGRGTSTFDGLSIAWAVIEYIADKKKLGSKALFATHYHELTELEGKLDGVQNYCIAVREKGDDIIFLRKIVRGGANTSYGIQVARLAGVPSEVLRRAREISGQLSDADIAAAVKSLAPGGHPDGGYEQLSFPEPQEQAEESGDKILREIADLDLTVTTPIEALNALHQWQSTLRTKGRDQ